jgi:hypothetical protein
MQIKSIKIYLICLKFIPLSTIHLKQQRGNEMAIYHLNMKLIRRADGKSSVAAAAYRSGEKLYDERQNRFFDFTSKSKIDYTCILGGWVKSRQELWNEVEKVETRKNSRTAREFDIALPIELDNKQKIVLAITFIKSLQKKWKVIADLAFHNLNGNNPHFHVMLTTREYIPGIGFCKKIREMDKKIFLEYAREQWAKICNIFSCRIKAPATH